MATNLFAKLFPVFCFCYSIIVPYRNRLTGNTSPGIDTMANKWKTVDVARFWCQRPTGTLVKYNISLRREQEIQRRKLNRQDVVNRRRQTFINENHLEESDVSSIIQTSESQDLEFWCANQSWSFCSKCLMLSPRKLLPSFRNRPPTALETKCKCGDGIDEVPSVDDFPLILRNLTEEDL